MTISGVKLKQARHKLNLTQHGLADALGMSRVMVGLMERGERPIERRTWLAVQHLLYLKTELDKLKTAYSTQEFSEC